MSGEYLVAMKLMSGRKYKNDISDVVGILREEKEKGTPITYEKISKAVCDLYGDWEKIPQDSRVLIREVLREGNLEELFAKLRSMEKETKTSLIAFEKEYPEVLNPDNLDDVINSLRRKKAKEEIER